MTTVKPSSIPAPHDIKPTVALDNSCYRGPRSYMKPGAPEPSQVGFLPAVSVACSTEDDEAEGFGYRGQRKNYRGRGRGGYRRRAEGVRFHQPHGSSYRGQGLDRLY